MSCGLVRDARGGALVDERAPLEAVKRERSNERVRPVVGYGECHGIAAGGNRLEAAGAPAAVEVKIIDRRLAHDRARIRRDVDDAGPVPHELEARERRKEFDGGRDEILDDRKTSALRI